MSKPIHFNKSTGKYTKLNETHENYIRMYHAYFVLHWSWNEICEHYACSKSTVTGAIRWVIDNKLKFPSKYLIEGAIDTIANRLKKNQELLDNELNKSRNKDKIFIIALNREIREDEKAINKMLEIVSDDTDTEGSIKAADVLKLIAANSKNK